MSASTMSEIRGVDVITSDKGENLGPVVRIFLDPDTNKLSALSFKDRGKGAERSVDNEHITLVGQDVILIQSASRATEIEGDQEPGRRLLELRGMMVTTADGRNMGRLEDFLLDQQTRELSELLLAEGRTLPVEGREITIGEDTIIVPAAAADQVRSAPEKAGIFQRMGSWARRGSEKLSQKVKKAEAKPE